MKISDSMIKKICSSMIYKRGVEYFREGRVHMRKRSENELTAVVDGEELYSVQIKLNDNAIGSVLCSCPYYETMQNTCKHIVAVLKQREAELEQGVDYTNENDKLAELVCNDFSETNEQIRIHAFFTLFINKKGNGNIGYEMSLSLPEYGGMVQGLENFLDCYLNYRDFKIDRSNLYSRKKMYFSENDDNIISILAEVYETRASEIKLYHKESYRTSFGVAVIRRMLPYLSNVDFKIIYDGMTLNGVRVINEDPDILVDIEAFDGEIILSVFENGLALTTDGEWFLYNDTIYKTSSRWREYFMPIYRALQSENRTQISFKGDNTMSFAVNVLPRLRNRHGVVITGIDDFIVSGKPEFEVCLDAYDNKITAVIAAKYGSIKFRIPSDNYETNGKLVVRDVESENNILRLFNEFDREKSVFSLSGDYEIYNFITETVPYLNEISILILTDRFKSMQIKKDIDLSIGVVYKNDIDFLEINFDTNLTSDEIKGILSAMRKHNDFYRTSDGSFINLKDNNKTDILRLLERLDLTNIDIESGSKKLPKFHMLYLAARNDVNQDDSVKKYLEEVRSISAKLPDSLKTVLRPYQKDGVKWLSELSEMGMGGILADDMGLGKTLQVIAFVKGQKLKEPSLIIAPSALVYNWQNEIEKFTPGTKSLIISGSKDIRKELIDSINDYEFIITSYPLLRRDIALYKHISFAYCFIDEAQYIKNPKTMNSISVKQIRSKHKFALTGTPIENSLMELWSIFDFVMPGYLKGSHEFRDRYEIPVQRDGDVSVSNNLRGIIKPFVLRRMKSEVLSELPEKVETTMLADLSKQQKALYMQFLSDAKSQAEGIIAHNGNRLMLLTLLLRLRQICCHPALFNDSDSDINIAESGKLELLMELIRNSIASGHRILVFSQFRSMLDIIAKILEKENTDYYYINGSTPSESRAGMAEDFNNGEREVFLVSLKAGGTGLNLTGADMVIHYDPWWNPAVTDQATDRAYRIGQLRNVQVIKLASKGTIEEKILSLQDKKRVLAEDIIRVNSETLASLSDEEVMSLFEF